MKAITESTKTADWANKYGISANFEFVPFSRSRNSEQKQPSLNWKVTLYKKDPDSMASAREFLRFDYSMGSGHAPSYKQNAKLRHEVEAVKYECEKGCKARYSPAMDINFPGKKIDPPKLADVLYSLSSDADALNYSTFEDWASEFGYDKDSRSAETIYKTCLEYALKLRGAVREKGLEELQSAVADM